MRPSVKKPLRILFGIIAGLVSASLLSVGLLILVVIVCAADMDGGVYRGHQRHEWVGDLSLIAAFGIVTIIPLAGVIMGIVWARRRNRRDEAIWRPGEPAA